MANKYQDSKETIKVRGMMLRSMADTYKTLKMMSNSLKLSIGVLNYHVKEMVEENRVKQETRLIDGKERITYICIDKDYLAAVAEQIAKEKAIEDARVKRSPFARDVILTDKHHWTPTAKKSRNAWTGTTLGTMTF